MCICVYVCMRQYVYMCICIYVYMHICMYAGICIHRCIYVYVYVYVYVHMYMCMDACMQAGMYVCMYLDTKNSRQEEARGPHGRGDESAESPLSLVTLGTQET